MPVEVAHPRSGRVTHLEAFGRTLAGIAPWLEAPNLTGEEIASDDRGIGAAILCGRRAIQTRRTPEFSQDRQPLVDAAFLAHGILRAPRVLWDDLDAETRALVIAALKQTRGIFPNINNWLLFAAMVETFLEKFAGEGDLLRIDYALRQHEQGMGGPRAMAALSLGLLQQLRDPADAARHHGGYGRRRIGITGKRGAGASYAAIQSG
jgi:hypothetical protein